MNEYIKDSSTWGVEQFVLMDSNEIFAYVSCQIIQEQMWVGWSLRPNLCGMGLGKEFIDKCLRELIELKEYDNKSVFLKVINWNDRAIYTYKKAGFYHFDKLIRIEEGNHVEYLIMKIDIKIEK